MSNDQRWSFSKNTFMHSPIRMKLKASFSKHWFAKDPFWLTDDVPVMSSQKHGGPQSTSIFDWSEPKLLGSAPEPLRFGSSSIVHHLFFPPDELLRCLINLYESAGQFPLDILFIKSESPRGIQEVRLTEIRNSSVRKYSVFLFTVGVTF